MQSITRPAPERPAPGDSPPQFDRRAPARKQSSFGACARAILPAAFRISRCAAPVAHFVDLHAHYLPALDDGATSREMSMQMVRAIAVAWIRRTLCDAHQRAGMFMPARAAIDAAFAAVSADVAGAAVRRSTLGLGAENFWDDVLHGRLRERTVPSYGGGAGVPVRGAPAVHAGGDRERAVPAARRRVPAGDGAPRALRRRSSATSTLAERLGRHAVLMVDLGALDGAHGTRRDEDGAQAGAGGAGARGRVRHPPSRGPDVGSRRAWPGSASSWGPAVLEQMLAENTRRAAGRRDARRAGRVARAAAATSARPAARPLRRRRLPSPASPTPSRAGDSTGISIFIDSRMTTVCPRRRRRRP